jgi:hypothetical protein
MSFSLAAAKMAWHVVPHPKVSRVAVETFKFAAVRAATVMQPVRPSRMLNANISTKVRYSQMKIAEDG